MPLWPSLFIRQKCYRRIHNTHVVHEENQNVGLLRSVDLEKKQKGLNEVMSKSVPSCSVQWFEIDEHTHGSVATFPNKAAYDEMTNLRNNHRKEATDSGIKMIYEVIGHLKAEGKS